MLARLRSTGGERPADVFAVFTSQRKVEGNFPPNLAVATATFRGGFPSMPRTLTKAVKSFTTKSQTVDAVVPEKKDNDKLGSRWALEQFGRRLGHNCSVDEEIVDEKSTAAMQLEAV